MVKGGESLDGGCIPAHRDGHKIGDRSYIHTQSHVYINRWRLARLKLTVHVLVSIQSLSKLHQNQEEAGRR